MKTYRVAVIPGDGIGHEVVPAAIRALDAVAGRSGFRLEWEHFPWGSQHYFDHGRMMPADALDRLRAFEVIFFGGAGFSATFAKAPTPTTEASPPNIVPKNPLRVMLLETDRWVILLVLWRWRLDKYCATAKVDGARSSTSLQPTSLRATAPQ